MQNFVVLICIKTQPTAQSDQKSWKLILARVESYAIGKDYNPINRRHHQRTNRPSLIARIFNFSPFDRLTFWLRLARFRMLISLFCRNCNPPKKKFNSTRCYEERILMLLPLSSELVKISRCPKTFFFCLFIHIISDLHWLCEWGKFLWKDHRQMWSPVSRRGMFTSLARVSFDLSTIVRVSSNLSRKWLHPRPPSSDFQLLFACRPFYLGTSECENVFTVEPCGAHSLMQRAIVSRLSWLCLGCQFVRQ